MTTQSLALLDSSVFPGAMVSIERIKHSLEEMHRLVDDVLVENVHYGIIPGTQSKTLLKPGAEILFKAFLCRPRHRPEPLILNPENRYILLQVICEAVHIATGEVLAEGMGAADSNKWIDTKVDFGWLYNSTLKIAEKRAEVDCALKLGAVSAHFTQDMEDYGEIGAGDGLLALCPLHKTAWRQGKYGKEHNKQGGGWCHLKDIIKSELNEFIGKKKIEPKTMDAYVRQEFKTPWSKLNEVEQVKVLEWAATQGQEPPTEMMLEATEASPQLASVEDLKSLWDTAQDLWGTADASERLSVFVHEKYDVNSPRQLTAVQITEAKEELRTRLEEATEAEAQEAIQESLSF